MRYKPPAEPRICYPTAGCSPLLVLAILAYLLLRTPTGGPSGLEREAAALAGQLEGKNEEETEAELNRTVEEGMFNIASTPHRSLTTEGLRALSRSKTYWATAT